VKGTKSRRGATKSTDQETRDCSNRYSTSPTDVEVYSGTEREFRAELWRAFTTVAVPSEVKCSSLAYFAGAILTNIQTQKLISEFKAWAHRSVMMGSPTIDHLLVFVKLNVLRAMISNSKDLGFKPEENATEDALSPFTDPSSPVCCSRALPSALQPTKLQREIPHHPWIDILPIPGMRDNLLHAGDSYDDMKLCGDLVGVCGGPADRTALILWGEPWEPKDWEVSESFSSQWAWTIRGCSELFESTNYWRKRRGEKPLKFEGLLYEETAK